MTSPNVPRTPSLGTLIPNLLPFHIDARDGKVDHQCLDQSMEKATDLGWPLVPKLYHQNLLDEILGTTHHTQMWMTLETQNKTTSTIRELFPSSTDQIRYIPNGN